MAELEIRYVNQQELDIYNKESKKKEKIKGYIITLTIKDAGTIGIKGTSGMWQPNYTFEDFKDNMQEYIDFGPELYDYVNICIPTENKERENVHNQLITLDELIEEVVDRLNEIGKRVKTIKEVSKRFTQSATERQKIKLDF